MATKKPAAPTATHTAAAKPAPAKSASAKSAPATPATPAAKAAPAKAAAAKAPPAKAATKGGATIAPPAAGAKPNALQQPLKPSKELAAIVGAEPLARGRVVSLVWDYIKAHNLQNPENKREIVADEKLRHVFGKDRVTMFEMNKHLAQHLS